MSKPKILVVDDEKSIRLTIAQSLEPQGYSVDTAVNGHDALDQLQKETFDLLLTDLKMPGMEGTTLIEEAIQLQADLQIIVISAHGTVDNAVEVMKLGAVDFIQKPFTPNEIRELVKQVLDRKTRAEDASSFDSLMESAKYQASQRQLEDAIATVKEAIGVDPSQPSAFVLLGQLQESLGDRLEGIKNYRVALDLDPTHQDAQKNLDRATTSTFRPSLS
ncbi:sigma-54 dependent transcriptional regulator [Acaryochloris sp. CCMEE 5410]|uniref:sigma-54-dependent transcriptional regulator n=1 Tax=Acaryochloris sp. CCMEE 5410 TaxID=310037 RepID=UPI0002484287|nr:response regulator [Acaryochloris sp. CCMEE 5410]KAI9132826.1 response regulator [Acaryochloris sp. CCMEE 5410]